MLLTRSEIARRREDYFRIGRRRIYFGYAAFVILLLAGFVLLPYLLIITGVAEWIDSLDIPLWLGIAGIFFLPLAYFLLVFFLMFGIYMNARRLLNRLGLLCPFCGQPLDGDEFMGDPVDSGRCLHCNEIVVSDLSP